MQAKNNINKEYIIVYSTIKEKKFEGKSKDDVKLQLKNEDSRAVVMDIKRL